MLRHTSDTTLISDRSTMRWAKGLGSSGWIMRTSVDLRTELGVQAVPKWNTALNTKDFLGIKEIVLAAPSKLCQLLDTPLTLGTGNERASSRHVRRAGNLLVLPWSGRRCGGRQHPTDTMHQEEWRVDPGFVQCNASAVRSQGFRDRAGSCATGRASYGDECRRLELKSLADLSFNVLVIVGGRSSARKILDLLDCFPVWTH